IHRVVPAPLRGRVRVLDLEVDRACPSPLIRSTPRVRPAHPLDRRRRLPRAARRRPGRRRAPASCRSAAGRGRVVALRASAVGERWLAGDPTWSQLTPAGALPAGLEYQTAIYDPVRDRLIVFGGTDGTSRHAELWALPLADPSAWSALAASGVAPTARERHA